MRRLVVLLLLATALTSCGGDDTVDVPKGVTVRLEQVRQDLQNRKFSVQVVNHGTTSITVEKARLESGRLPKAAVYTGPAVIEPGTEVNLTTEMPPARCGRGLDATVRLTYSVDDGKTVESTVKPTDHFGSVGRFMKRDCAARTLGKLVIDDRLTVRGKGKNATISVGFTVTPPAKGDPVHLVRVDGSTLLAPESDAATTIDRTTEPGGEPLHAEVTFIPNRCDVHVVAEDRTGGIVPLRLESKAFGSSPIYLRFKEPQKAQIFDYLAERCGFGKVQDPLNAP
ncbi:hypothetical protein [Aeromicrobium terrae]|uniref:Lipoprotein n=1 Tax=Aeromicrobium terrae TaxID=2498846 RepID=A0A5C8NEW8_9ACTN|nr:hypothetical protein [Aeromicrobium terrae]TXL57453.1 hypothetical protein FHP06_13830 [Aeromicrobium terrae]